MLYDYFQSWSRFCIFGSETLAMTTPWCIEFNDPNATAIRNFGFEIRVSQIDNVRSRRIESCDVLDTAYSQYWNKKNCKLTSQWSNLLVSDVNPSSWWTDEEMTRNSLVLTEKNLHFGLRNPFITERDTFTLGVMNQENELNCYFSVG